MNESRTLLDADCWSCANEISDELKIQGDLVAAISYVMYLCPDCGSKRCPKASDCGRRCIVETEKEIEGYKALSRDPDRIPRRRPGPDGRQA